MHELNSQYCCYMPHDTIIMIQVLYLCFCRFSLQYIESHDCWLISSVEVPSCLMVKPVDSDSLIMFNPCTVDCRCISAVIFPSKQVIAIQLTWWLSHELVAWQFVPNSGTMYVYSGDGISTMVWWIRADIYLLLNWLGVRNMIFIFHFIYGMSSFPLTFIFFKMVKTTNQYNMNGSWDYSDIWWD